RRTWGIPLRLRSLLRCRAHLEKPGGTKSRPVAAAVLRWCSPQSSVPRQTVGHHAKTAKYETGPTAAREGCRGEVPRRPKLGFPSSPPAGAVFPFPRIPSDRCAVGRTGRRASGWISRLRKIHLYGIC